MTATAGAICDRIQTLITALVPTMHAEVRFNPFRNEADADFMSAMAKNTAGAFRRFQVRVQGYDGPPPVNNMLVVERRLIVQIAIAYPANARTGSKNAIDRDKAMDADWRAINYACGITGGGNFSGDADCTPLGLDEPSWERQGAVDFAVMRGIYQFWGAAGPT